MSYDCDCSVYWCDKCGRECVINWHNSGDWLLVLKCTKCDFTRDYISLEDVIRRHCTQCGYGHFPKTGFKKTRSDGLYPYGPPLEERQ